MRFWLRIIIMLIFGRAKITNKHIIEQSVGEVLWFPGYKSDLKDYNFFGKFIG